MIRHLRKTDSPCVGFFNFIIYHMIFPVINVYRYVFCGENHVFMAVACDYDKNFSYICCQKFLQI